MKSSGTDAEPLLAHQKKVLVHKKGGVRRGRAYIDFRFFFLFADIPGTRYALLRQSTNHHLKRGHVVALNDVSPPSGKKKIKQEEHTPYKSLLWVMSRSEPAPYEDAPFDVDAMLRIIFIFDADDRTLSLRPETTNDVRGMRLRRTKTN